MSSIFIKKILLLFNYCIILFQDNLIKGEMMAIINGVDMPNFTKKEIPEFASKLMSKQILENVQKYRSILNRPFSISSAYGALFRFDGRKSSEHYVIVDPITDRLIKPSTAIDGFPYCNIFQAWTLALSSGLFGGIGVYFDTKNNHGDYGPMLHLDLRQNNLIWYRSNGIYYYPGKDTDFFTTLKYLLTAE